MHIQHESDDDGDDEASYPSSPDAKLAWVNEAFKGGEDSFSAGTSSGEEGGGFVGRKRSLCAVTTGTTAPKRLRVTVAKLYHGSCAARVLRKKRQQTQKEQEQRRLRQQTED